MSHPEQPGSAEQPVRWEAWALTIQAEIEAAISRLIQERFPHVLALTGEYREGKFSVETIGYDQRILLPTEQKQREE